MTNQKEPEIDAVDVLLDMLESMEARGKEDPLCRLMAINLISQLDHDDAES